jgi:hypothetical protein
MVSPSSGPRHDPQFLRYATLLAALTPAAPLAARAGGAPGGRGTDSAMQDGKLPARRRAAIPATCSGNPGSPPRLRALAFATADTVGYIIGGSRYGEAPGDVGKFTLTLRRSGSGRWLIASDMDHGNAMRRRPGSQ